MPEWTCPHEVTYSGSEDFVSGARNAHGEYEAAVARRDVEGVLLGFKPHGEDEPWTVRRCEDVRCNAPLSDPFEVR